MSMLTQAMGFGGPGVDPDLHNGSWEINVGREALDSLPHTPRKGRGDQPSSGGNSPGRQPVVRPFCGLKVRANYALCQKVRACEKRSFPRLFWL